MGQAINQTEFNKEDYLKFSDKLQDNIHILEKILNRKDFGEGPMSIGAELELSIIDKAGKALCINTDLLQQLDDPYMQPELNRFNLEFNLPHTDFANSAFTTLENHIKKQLGTLNEVAKTHQAKIVSIGILPTLDMNDFGPACMTDLPRYHTLANGIKQLRGEPFQINIAGQQLLEIERDDLTLEGANTSFQIHLRVPPKDYVNTYNAVQLVTPIALALSANSPFLLGQRLWDETRVVLFKQAVDTRKSADKNSRRKMPARVNFGTGWVRKSALELFAESVALFEPLIPILHEEDPKACLQKGDMPKLKEMKLHQSSIWQWNRAIYDHHDAGHLRIEMRALPSGPTPMDMLANTVFLVGSALSLQKHIDKILPSFPFQFAEDNFYRAAKHGLHAKLLWPTGTPEFPKETSIADIVSRLVPQATEALIEYGLAEKEVMHYMSIISDRIEANMNGSIWQNHLFEQYNKTLSREEALQAMLNRYLEEQSQNRPVSEWSLSL